MTTPNGVDYFGRAHPLRRLNARVTYRVRRRIYEWFREEIGGVEGKTILDHGTTPDTDRICSNCFVRWMLQDGANVLCASPEDIRSLTTTLRGVQVLSWPINVAELPPVDAVLSSAVVEHVGNASQQREYITSLLKLAPRVLITTPNRFHWLEFHTKLPLLHWLPRPWHRRVLGWLGYGEWQLEEHLRLLSKKDFTDYLAAAQSETDHSAAQWYAPRFLGVVSNLVALSQIKE